MRTCTGWIFILVCLGGIVSCKEKNPVEFGAQVELKQPLSSVQKLAVLAAGKNEYISVVDVENGIEVGVFHVGESVYRCAIRPTDNSIWFTILNDGFYYIDAYTNNIVSTGLPITGGDIVFSPDGQSVFVARRQLVIADPDQLDRYEIIQQPSSYALSTLGIQVGEVVILGLPSVSKENSDGTTSISGQGDLAKWMILDNETKKFQIGEASIGFPQKRPVVTEVGDAIVSLNAFQNKISFYNRIDDTVEFLPIPVRFDAPITSYLGYDHQKGHIYISVFYLDTNKDRQAFVETTDIVVFDISSKSFPITYTLPQLYMGGALDPLSKQVVMVGPLPLTPTEGIEKPIETLTVYNLETQKIDKTIPVDQRIHVGASVSLNTIQ